MARVYERLRDEGSADFDAYVWQGHAHQLAGNWREAAEGYVGALDRLDLELDTPPVAARAPRKSARRVIGRSVRSSRAGRPKVRRGALLRRRSVLIFLAGLIQRDLVGDQEGAAADFSAHLPTLRLAENVCREVGP